MKKKPGVSHLSDEQTTATHSRHQLDVFPVCAAIGQLLPAPGSLSSPQTGSRFDVDTQTQKDKKKETFVYLLQLFLLLEPLFCGEVVWEQNTHKIVQINCQCKEIERKSGEDALACERQSKWFEQGASHSKLAAGNMANVWDRWTRIINRPSKSWWKPPTFFAYEKSNQDFKCERKKISTHQNHFRKKPFSTKQCQVPPNLSSDVQVLYDTQNCRLSIRKRRRKKMKA